MSINSPRVEDGGYETVVFRVDDSYPSVWDSVDEEESSTEAEAQRVTPR